MRSRRANKLVFRGTTTMYSKYSSFIQHTRRILCCGVQVFATHTEDKGLLYARMQVVTPGASNKSAHAREVRATIRVCHALCPPCECIYIKTSLLHFVQQQRFFFRLRILNKNSSIKISFGLLLLSLSARSRCELMQKLKNNSFFFCFVLLTRAHINIYK